MTGSEIIRHQKEREEDDRITISKILTKCKAGRDMCASIFLKRVKKVYSDKGF